MTTYYLNGNPITEDSDITLNGITYPYAWLEGTSPSVRASLGIEASVDINFDVRYYNSKDVAKPLEDREEVDNDGDPVYVQVYDVATETMVDTTIRLVAQGLKTNCLNEIKTKTNDVLQPTDFYILRNHVEETEIPADVVTYRAAVVTESTRLQTAIPTVTTVEELISVMNSAAWPSFPVKIVVEESVGIPGPNPILPS
jgi:hypothetical protein